MRRNLAYLRYVLRHKWFVLRACLRVGASWWQGILHDWTKFLPREWGTYARYFYNDDGTNRKGQDERADAALDLAWCAHQKCNKHHWQAWVVIGDAGYISPLPMPECYVREMIADWIGAGQAIAGRSDPTCWYLTNGHKMLLHPETRQRVEQLLTDLSTQ